MKAILDLATTHGNFLHSSWKYVLQCISKIESFHSKGAGARSDAEILGQSHLKPKREQEMIEQSYCQNIWANIDQSVIDKVFSRSSFLDAESIMDFISALCKLSE